MKALEMGLAAKKFALRFFLGSTYQFWVVILRHPSM